jgi:hypothetical protein
MKTICGTYAFVIAGRRHQRDDVADPLLRPKHDGRWQADPHRLSGVLERLSVTCMTWYTRVVPAKPRQRRRPSPRS